MSYEEKGTWAYLVATIGTYAVYLAIMLTRLQSTPASHVEYVTVLTWTVSASIVASTIIRTAIETARPSESRRRDVRDKEIARHGEYASRWFIAAAAFAALILAMVKSDYFWIANVIYLGFVLWAVSSSVLRLVAYRRGL
ncbi:MAG TPA: hypothetical protein VFI65_09195 [Streptosporangiaceae bacterium]|nr:hypothetical protein [Streptosporangiaceae bacterium]